MRYGAQATRAVTGPRVFFEVLPTEFEAFAVRADRSLAAPTYPELAVEFRFWLPGRPVTRMWPSGSSPSEEELGNHDGGYRLTRAGGWAAKQLDEALLVY